MSDFDLDGKNDNLEIENLFDVNDDPFAIEPDSREPIEAMLDGALNQIKDREAQADIGRIILDNALPSGYRIGKNTVETIVKDLTSLYDDTTKRLKEPVNKIRKDMARIVKERNVQGLFGMDQAQLIEMLTPTETRARVSVNSGNIQDNAVESMLNSIFVRDQVVRREDLAIAEAESTARARLDEASNSELRRITAFQDTVQFDWMRKSLELQQRSFYLQQEQLGVAKAAGIDAKSAFDALVKNTSLPDYVKSTLGEDYQEEAQAKIFGGIAGRMTDFSKGFGQRLRERLQSKGQGILGSLESIVGPLSELTGELADVDESVSIGEVIGGVGAGMAAEGSAGTIGMLLRKVIRDNPTLAKFNEELMFYAENFPQELTEALESWNGGFSKDMVKRFPFLAQIRSATLADELRALIPPIEDVIIGVNQNLEGDGANMGRPFDEITRRSIIEIIPGFLSRILEQVTIANFGPDSERIVYDINSEMFKTQREAADQALRRVQGSVGMTDRMNVLAVRDMFNNGKFVSDDIAEMLVKVSKELREEGREMNREEVLDRLLDKGEIRMIGRVGNLFDNSGLGEQEIAQQIRKLAMNQDVGARKELITQEVTSRINRTRLSPEALIAFEDWFTSYARLNMRPKKEKMQQDLEDMGIDEATIAEMVNFIAGSELSSRQIDRELAKGSRGVGDGFFGMQEEIKRMYEAGQKDLLDNMGVTTVNETSDNVVNEMLYGRFSREDFLANLEENRSTRFSPRANQNDLASQLDDRIETSTDPVTRTTMDMTGFNIPSAMDMWNAFSVTINEMVGVPVHILSDAGNRIDQPGPKDTTHEQRMFDLVERGFTVTGELLDGILRKDLTVEIEQTGLISQLIKGTSNVTSAGLGFLGKYTQGVFNMGSSMVGAGGRLAGGALHGAGALIGGALNLGTSPFRKNDIYVEGEREPVITARDLRKGRFIDVTTGKPIRNLKDIKGRVEDADGNVILTEEQLDNGIYDRAGNNLTALTSFVGSAFTGFANIWKWQTRTAINAIKGVLSVPGKMLGVFKRARDVYVADDMTIPKLSAQIMRNGGYFSENGTPIKYPRDIDGQVRDSSGNIVLSHEDILKGLVFVDGTPVDSNAAYQAAKKATSLLWSGAKLAWKANMGIVKAGVSTGMGVLRGAGNLVGGIFGGRQAARDAAVEEISKISEAGGLAGSRSDVFLEGILTFMMARWPLETAGQSEELMSEQLSILQEMMKKDTIAKNDRDGDGDRDNSISDILSRRGQKLDGDQAKQTVEDNEEKSKDPALFGLVGGIAAAIGTVVTTLGGMSQTLLGILAASKGADVAGDILDMGGEDGDRKKGGRRGRGGRFGKIGNAAKSLGRGAANVGSRAAMAMGARQLATRGATAGLAAVAGTTLAPVIGAAGLAWGAWEIGNFMWNRSDAEPLERLRFMQYGLDPEETSHRVLIRKTESELEDLIVTARGEVKVSAPDKDVIIDLMETWGVDPTDEAAASDFMSWLKNRCIPIFSRHVGVLHGIDRSVDVTDVDDEIKEEHIPQYLMAIKSFPGANNPLDHTVIPSAGIMRLITKGETTIYHDGLLAKYGKDVKTDKIAQEAMKNFEENAKNVAASVIVANSTADAYTQLAQQRRKEQIAAITTTATVTTVTETRRNNDLKEMENEYNELRKRNQQQTSGNNVSPLSGGAVTETGRIRLIKPCRGRLTSPFGPRRYKGSTSPHKGVDWADYEGSPIVAAANGKIVRHAYSTSYGKCIYIEHPNGWHTRYAHLHAWAPGLKLGSVVRQGQFIGTMGNTGESRGVHLHFELRDGFGNDSRAYNPLDYIVDGNAEKQAIEQTKKDLREEIKTGKAMDTIEGVDTIVEEVASPYVSGSDTDILAKQKAEQMKTNMPETQTIDRVQREIGNASLEEIIKISTTSTDESAKQTKLLTAIAKNTKATTDALMMLAEELGKRPATDSLVGGQKTDSVNKPKPTPTTGNIQPLVDMGN